MRALPPELTAPIRILVVDDDRHLRSAVSDLIASDPAFELIGVVDTVAGAIAAALIEPPDLALIDVEMPDGGGERLAVALRQISSRTRVVAYSAYNDSGNVWRMIRAGAQGYLTKADRSRDLLQALSALAAGESLFEVPAGALADISAAAGQATDDLSEQRFSGLVDGLPGYVYACALDFMRTHFISSRAFELTGYTAAEHLEHPELWLSQVHPDDRERVIRDFAEGTATGEPVKTEYRLIRKDGQQRWFSDHARKVQGNSEQEAFYQGVVLDITEAKDADLARAESLAKSRFFAGMSHELRNPLNSVLGFAELLESKELGTLSDRQSRYVHNIRQSGQLLLELVNDVLDFSKIQAGQMTAEIQPLAVGEAVAGAVEKMAPIAGAKGIRLEVIDAHCGATALADQRRLTQVLLNLLSNAIKFTPAEGSVSVSCRLTPGGVQVEVRDTGIGIPQEQLSAIFDEFVQVDNEQTRSQTGTGLGLALSRGLMTLMGGSIAVASVAGQGSTFTLTLPAAPTSHDSDCEEVA